MMNVKLIIAYDGTRYNGWQKQGNVHNTIQEKLEETISRLVGEPIEIAGSGRTDAGVHALAQTANFKMSDRAVRKSGENCLWHEASGDSFFASFQKTLNSYLPQDIRILDVCEADERFHARLSAKGKHYSYRIDQGEVARIFDRKYVARIDTPLDLEKMKKAAGYLVGQHDYKSFCANKRMKKSTVRTVRKIEFHKSEGQIKIDFYGDGFLYHMIRIMVGTLVEVGRHERKPEEMETILQALDRSRAGYLAPAQGLFLEEVFYETP